MGLSLRLLSFGFLLVCVCDTNQNRFAGLPDSAVVVSSKVVIFTAFRIGDM